jgi:hypothetical protein
MIFPGIPLTCRGRSIAGILRKAAYIFTDASVLYTKPLNCCKIQALWEQGFHKVAGFLKVLVCQATL